MEAVYVTRNTPFSASLGERTVLKLIAPASSFQIKVLGIGVSLDGIANNAVPATFEWGTSDETTGGASVGTPVTTQIKGRPQAHGITIGQNFSLGNEGTVYTVIGGVYVPQFQGRFVLQNPLGVEFETPESDGTTNSFFLRLNVPGGGQVNALAWIKWTRH